MRISPIFILLILLLTQNSFAQVKPTPTDDLKDQVTKGVSPDDWLNDIRKASGGKWNEVAKASAPMAQILQVATDAIGEKTNSGTDCKRAAATVGYQIVFDAYSTVGLQGLLDALKEAVAKIIKLRKGELEKATSGGPVGGESALKKFEEKLNEEGREHMEEYIKEQLAKGKPEVFTSKVTKGNCQVVLVSIWDQAGGSYDALVYGNCKCTPQSNGTPRGSSRLGTFAVRVKGRVTVGIDFDKKSPTLNVGVPSEVTVEANCETCTKGATGTTTSTTQPAPPQEKFDFCDQKPPCKDCTQFYDRIVAACKRIKEIDYELRQRTGEFQGRENTRTYVKNEIAQLEKQGAGAAERLKAKQEELKEIEREARQAQINGYGLGLDRQELERSLTDLLKQMRECEKTKCGKAKTTTTTGVNTASKVDPCLIGTWRSEPGDPGIYGGGGIVFTVRPDGMGTMDYDALKPFVQRSQFFEDGNDTTKITGKATGQIHTDENHYISLLGDFTSSMTLKETHPDGTTREPKLGHFFPRGDQVAHYTCNRDGTLTLFENMQFKKVE